MKKIKKIIFIIVSLMFLYLISWYNFGYEPKEPFNRPYFRGRIKIENYKTKLSYLYDDEWGYIPISLRGAELLFQVIADFYERKSLIITTNLEFGKWISIFMDKKLTSAIIDRIIHHCHILHFTGSSYRIKNSTINSI